MFIQRAVSAHLVERFIFNFCIRPEVLASYIPVSFLYPQVLYGWSVVSFCLLKLEHVMLTPLPSSLGLTTVSCAYRCGVIDDSQLEATPSVYIPARYTDRALLSTLGPLIFASPLYYVRVSLQQKGSATKILVRHLDGRLLFSALVRRAMQPTIINSQVFASLDAFASFIMHGTSSYTPTLHKKSLARVDLAKDDTVYEVLSASVEYNGLERQWPLGELILDSAVRATGGCYKWTYCGCFEDIF
ncbi:hypothetical protein EPA93_01545 [Ktedonosporobacter rubrisoli]|uniref:DUF2071 domain-containing protein n=1 Tax=Ktedonosporobacter rubrisoli TaxID=2509675 RepID=A0A4P6JIE4_KTERU|nr:hypothetical protein [Ktedonosporobacter rubrisoli]QBD74743.1 hypothetical protein EPA93_01545 [Ktedonosporobacter rubrisoli]